VYAKRTATHIKARIADTAASSDAKNPVFCDALTQDKNSALSVKALLPEQIGGMQHGLYCY
jgi:hypothetical protein